MADRILQFNRGAQYATKFAGKHGFAKMTVPNGHAQARSMERVTVPPVKQTRDDLATELEILRCEVAQMRLEAEESDLIIERLHGRIAELERNRGR